ncbi:MAG: hypothetical protein ACRDH5_09800 [bacterium]
MDTGNDPRFSVLDRALLDVKRIFEMGRVKKAIDKHKAVTTCEHGHRLLMTLRYCYGEPGQMRAMGEFRELMGVADDVEALLGGPAFPEQIKEQPIAVAQVAWTLATLRSLGPRLDLPGSQAETAIDVAAGRVVSAHPHPEADNLLVTRLGAGRPLVVVTNDATVKAEDRVGVAILPPIDLRGVVSQGMFLGAGHGILKTVQAGPGGRPDVPDNAYGETRSMVKQYLEHK